MHGGPNNSSLTSANWVLAGSLNWTQIVIESIGFLMLLVATIVVVYFLPLAVSLAYFAILCAVFYATDKDYFWLAFFIVLASKPGNFFHSFGEGHDFGGIGIELPELSVAAGINISVLEIFFALALLKAVAQGVRYRYLLARPLLVLAGYLAVLLVVSVLAFEVSLVRLLKDLRNVFYFSSFVTIAYLLSRPKDVYHFIFMLFPAVAFVLAVQLFFYVTGDYPVNYLVPNLITTVARMGEGARYLPFGSDVLIVLLSYGLALALLSIRRSGGGPTVYLCVVVFLSFLSLFLTGTRVWFVFLGIVGLVASFALRVKSGMFVGIILSAALTFASLAFVPQVQTTMMNAWDRVSTLAGLGHQGNDATAQVESKLAERLPRVLEGFRLSPILGLGFSDTVHEYRDTDVGNFSLLAEVGIVGFAAFCYLWFACFVLCRKVLQLTSKSNRYRGSVVIMAAVLFGLLVAHFTTNGMYGYHVGNGAALFHVVFLFLTEFFVLESVRRESVNPHRLAGFTEESVS
jgi:hypothetical protein